MKVRVASRSPSRKTTDSQNGCYPLSRTGSEHHVDTTKDNKFTVQKTSKRIIQTQKGNDPAHAVLSFVRLTLFQLVFWR